MSAFSLPDPATPFGERVARHVRDDLVAWLTTVGADGTPQPNPVWFLWDGSAFLIYSLADAARLAHIARNPHVSLNFAGNGMGGDIVIITGTARLAPEVGPADQNPDFVAKYQVRIDASFGAPANFAARYPTAIRVTPLKLRGH
jgi:PPOX class probable F420-dependent enzyme